MSLQNHRGLVVEDSGLYHGAVFLSCYLSIHLSFLVCIVSTHMDVWQPWLLASTDLSQKTGCTKNKDIPHNKETVVQLVWTEERGGWWVRNKRWWWLPGVGPFSFNKLSNYGQTDTEVMGGVLLQASAATPVCFHTHYYLMPYCMCLHVSREQTTDCIIQGTED